MKSPLATVVITCYNYGSYVDQAIKSVLGQTYDSIELIVINDGSTDKSDKVIKSLNERHSFKYVHQSNKGIIATRNLGVSLAKGEFIVQLDADDWLDPTYIEKTVQKAEKTGAEIVYTQAKIFGRANFITRAPEFNIEFLKHEGFMHAASLVHKSVFEGRKFDEYLDDKGNEDWDLYLDACMDGKKAVLLDEPLLNYRKHDTVKSRADKFENTKKELLVRHHVLSKQNSKHPDGMWYFSPYIELLRKCIDEKETKNNLEARLARAEHRLQKYENFPPVKLLLWLKTKAG